MARINIDDLPTDQKIDKDVMRKVFGGVEPTTFPVINPGALSAFDAGKLSQGMTGFNLKIGNPIKYYPGPFWKS